jgi:cytochrome c-type biogenesis protein CcmH
MPATVFRAFLLLSMCLVSAGQFSDRYTVSASTEVVQFSDSSLRDRYYQLVQELRCPKCQNQNLADSNAPISTDMKAQIHSMLEAQKTDEEIKQHLVSRYSEFILYRPQVNENTWFLWFAPLCFVLFGLLVVWRYGFSAGRGEADNAVNSAQLTEQQQQQLSELLGEKEDQS